MAVNLIWCPAELNCHIKARPTKLSEG